MFSYEQISTEREVTAIQIPDGTKVVLQQGTSVLITQQLGGSYTVMTERGAMFRLDERDADAIGKEPTGEQAEEQIGGTLEERVWAQLKKCYDPEIPVNIVDLGLVYDCSISDADSGNPVVGIKMTLTAPGCGMGPVLAEDVRTRVESLEGVEKADVEVVFDPPWNQNMMTEAARLQLGFM